MLNLSINTVVFDSTWKDILGVGSVRMDPAVPLLYDALEHDAEFRVLLFAARKFPRMRRLFRNETVSSYRNSTITNDDEET